MFSLIFFFVVLNNFSQTVVERKHVRALMFHSNILLKFWMNVLKLMYYSWIELLI